MELELYRESNAPVWVKRLEAEGGSLCCATAVAKNTRRNASHIFPKNESKTYNPDYNLFSQVIIQIKAFIVLKHTYIVRVFAFLWCDTNKTMWSDTGEPELVDLPLNILDKPLSRPFVILQMGRPAALVFQPQRPPNHRRARKNYLIIIVGKKPSFLQKQLAGLLLEYVGPPSKDKSINIHYIYI